MVYSKHIKRSLVIKRFEVTRWLDKSDRRSVVYSQVERKVNGFLVSKETVVLRRWGRSKQKFGFIKRVDKCWITTVKDLESWRFER